MVKTCDKISDILQIGDANAGPRLKSVARRLRQIGHRYGWKSPTILLTTGDLLAQASSPLSQAPIWYRYAKNQFSQEMHSLLTGLAQSYAPSEWL
jgi:hypothetical protein